MRRIQSLGTQANKSPEDTEAETLQEIMEFELAVSSKASFAEALRVEKVAKARQEIIKLREATGELVNKEEVYKKLFAFGQSVRNAMLAVPDRCIDSLIVASNRATAHQILVKEIHDALEKLTTPPEIKPDDENKN